MPSLQLRFQSPVMSSDGRLIGSLEHLVADQEGFDPHSIVVKESERFTGRWLAPGSWYFHDELLVPIKNVAEADENQVLLDLTAAEARKLRPYLSHRYRPVDSGTALGMVVALGTSGIAMPNLEEVADKRAGEIEISQDENVMLGHTGRMLGHVREVLFEEGELVGVVIKPQGFFHQDLLIPVRFLERSDDMALFVDATEEDIEKVQPIQP